MWIDVFWAWILVFCWYYIKIYSVSPSQQGSFDSWYQMLLFFSLSVALICRGGHIEHKLHGRFVKCFMLDVLSDASWARTHIFRIIKLLHRPPNYCSVHVRYPDASHPAVFVSKWLEVSVLKRRPQESFWPMDSRIANYVALSPFPPSYKKWSVLLEVCQYLLVFSTVLLNICS